MSIFFMTARLYKQVVKRKIMLRHRSRIEPERLYRKNPYQAALSSDKFQTIDDFGVAPQTLPITNLSFCIY
jgi:hypothetical protein